MKRVIKNSILMVIAAIAMTTCEDEKSISVTGIEFVNQNDFVVVTVGDTYQLTATVEPSNATEKGVIWSSSNASIASVSGSGLVTGNLPGLVEIVAITIDGAKSTAIEMMVTNPVVGIIFRGDMEIALNEKAFPKYGFMPPSAINTGVKWTSSAPSIVAVDDNTGEITGLEYGNATITAVLLENEEITGSFKVEVKLISVTGVALTRNTLNLNIGGTSTLEYAILPNNADNKEVTWSTSDENIATVDELTGLITAIAVGEAIITVTTEEGGFTDDCTVTVLAEAINLLINGSFEVPGTATEPVPGWTHVPVEWYPTYYTFTFDPPAGAYTTVAVQSTIPDFFSSAASGNNVAYMLNNATCGIYQLVDVTPGTTYTYKVDIGIRSQNAQQNTPMESIKILCENGITVHHRHMVREAAIAAGFVAGGNPLVLQAAGSFVAPEGVNRIRFQIDQCTRHVDGDTRTTQVFFDGCELFEQ